MPIMCQAEAIIAGTSIIPWDVDTFMHTASIVISLTLIDICTKNREDQWCKRTPRIKHYHLHTSSNGFYTTDGPNSQVSYKTIWSIQFPSPHSSFLSKIAINVQFICSYTVTMFIYCNNLNKVITILLVVLADTTLLLCNRVPETHPRV